MDSRPNQTMRGERPKRHNEKRWELPQVLGEPGSALMCYPFVLGFCDLTFQYFCTLSPFLNFKTVINEHSYAIACCKQGICFLILQEFVGWVSEDILTLKRVQTVENNGYFKAGLNAFCNMIWLQVYGGQGVTCSGSNKSALHWLIYLNYWSPVGGLFWKGLGGVAFLMTYVTSMPSLAHSLPLPCRLDVNSQQLLQHLPDHLPAAMLLATMIMN